MLKRRIKAIEEAVEKACGMGWRINLVSQVQDEEVTFVIKCSSIKQYDRAPIKSAYKMLDNICSLLKKEHNLNCSVYFMDMKLDTSYCEDKALIAKIDHDAFGKHPIPELFSFVEYVPLKKEEIFEEAMKELNKRINDLATEHGARAKIEQAAGYLCLDCSDRRRLKKYRKFEEAIEEKLEFLPITEADYIPSDWVQRADPNGKDRYGYVNSPWYVAYYGKEIAKRKKSFEMKKAIAHWPNYSDSRYYTHQNCSYVYEVVALIKRLGADVSRLEEDLKYARN